MSKMRVILLVVILGISGICAKDWGCKILSVSCRWGGRDMMGVYKKTDHTSCGRNVYEHTSSRKRTYQMYYENLNTSGSRMEQGTWNIRRIKKQEVKLAFAEDNSTEPQYIKGPWKTYFGMKREVELLIECKDESYRPGDLEFEDNSNHSNQTAHWSIAIRILVSTLAIATIAAFVYLLYRRNKTIKKKSTTTMPAMYASAPPAYTSDGQVSSLTEKVDLNIPAYNDKSYDPPKYDELSRA